MVSFAEPAVGALGGVLLGQEGRPPMRPDRPYTRQRHTAMLSTGKAPFKGAETATGRSVRQTSYFWYGIRRTLEHQLREGPLMHDAEANRDDRDDGAQAARETTEAPPEAIHARRLRAAAAAEASYILSMRGR